MVNVLVVDDDSLTRRVLRGFLEDQGHTVTEANDGRSCLSAVQNVSPDLVILDVFMPGMDGLDAIAQLKPRFPELKVLGISSGASHGATPYLSVMERFGADMVLQKPITAVQIAEAVAQLFGGDRGDA